MRSNLHCVPGSCNILAKYTTLYGGTLNFRIQGPQLGVVYKQARNGFTAEYLSWPIVSRSNSYFESSYHNLYVCVL